MKLRTKAHIAAPLVLVWRAFNDPVHIMQWDATTDWHTVKASNDLVVGGLLKLRIEHRHADTGFDFVGTYTRIEPMNLIE